MSRIAIVDYGMGNLYSVAKAFEALHAEVTVTDNPEELRAAERIVLPGVGAFGEGMRNLKERGLDKALAEEALVRATPFLGICLGMQLLAREGLEHGHHQGLGWLKATVRPFNVQQTGLREIQIGWNEVAPRPGSPLFAGLQGTPSFYFVHGYHLVSDEPATVAGLSHYGGRFIAAVQQDNVFGVQFHPEKSQEPGLTVLKNFLRWRPGMPQIPDTGGIKDVSSASFKIRVIPTLLLEGSRLVKTIRFDRRRDVGDPVKAPMVYDAQLADELIYLDITATREGRGVDRLVEAIRRVTGECFMPLTAGGGICSVEDVRRLLKAGADKVSINSAAVDRPELIREAAGTFGRQCIVVSIDVRKVNGTYEVFTQGGRRATGLEPVRWARQAAEAGAGEILLTSIDRDGTFEGYDLELVRSVAQAVNVPVIASGGAASMRDLAEAVTEGRASAVAAASLFHFRDLSPIKVKAGLKRAGLSVR